MRAPRAVALPRGRVWLRVAEPEWADPLDPAFAAVEGGRWNPPGSFPTLYLNADLPTARLQLQRLLEGTPFGLDDLDADAYVLVAATLPRDQICADAVSRPGLRALGLPASYPVADDGSEIGHDRCQPIGEALHGLGLRGVWCISAAARARSARELAWFPATRRSKARAVWPEPLPLGEWRDAAGWEDVGLGEQEDPVPAG